MIITTTTTPRDCGNIIMDDVMEKVGELVAADQGQSLRVPLHTLRQEGLQRHQGSFDGLSCGFGSGWYRRGHDSSLSFCRSVGEEKRRKEKDLLLYPYIHSYSPASLFSLSLFLSGINARGFPPARILWESIEAFPALWCVRIDVTQETFFSPSLFTVH